MSQKRPNHKSSSGSGRRPAPLTPLQRLAQAPRQPGRTLMGTLRQIEEPVEFEDEMFEPAIALFIDAHNGATKAVTIFDPEDEEIEDPYAVTVQVLIEGLLKPAEDPLGTFDHLLDDVGTPPRGAWIPGRIVVDDAALAERLRTELISLNIPIDAEEELPLIDEAFDALLETLGFDDDVPFEWDVPDDLLLPTFQAANTLWETVPWRLVTSTTPLTVELGAHGPVEGIATLYASVLGNRETVKGVACYFSLADFQRAIAAGHQVAELSDDDIDEALEMIQQMPGSEAIETMPRDLLRPMLREMAGEQAAATGALTSDTLLCTFEDVAELDDTYQEWLDEHGLRGPNPDRVPLFARSIADSEPEAPTERETIALRLTLEALSEFFQQHHTVLADGSAVGEELSTGVKVGGETVTVTFTPEEIVDFESDDEDDEEDDE